MRSPFPRVRTGLDVLVSRGFDALRGLRVGLVANAASVDCQFRHAADLLSQAPGVQLAALFGPEHGLFGQAQDLIAVGDQETPATALPVHSLYGDNFASLKPTPEQLRGLDALVIDLPDLGCRNYTFAATMMLCLEATAEAGLLAVVLDRPNPLGGVAVEGPIRKPGFESFVGLALVVTRHGLTLGELARLYRTERGLGANLLVIPCEGWRREMSFEETGLPWVMPSPNMPTPETAYVYPGQCLLEGTNLSEGRGTTRPFELCGAPWIDPFALAERLRAEQLPGVHFRPVYFRPTFHKFAREDCGGVQVHVLSREEFQPVRTGLGVLATLRELSGPRFAWRREPYEFVADRPAIDLLFGSDRERYGLEVGCSWRQLTTVWKGEEDAFLRNRQAFLLY
jgi:uncharacterized protein YbbC (DUF1343 family)